MSAWSLSTLLGALHEDVERRLAAARETLGHPVEKGDASEAVWLSLLAQYLPKRYEARRAFVVDSDGHFSEQMDIVIHDRQYSPFVFVIEGKAVVPAESVYAVFEAKQELSAQNVAYAAGKIRSVRGLKRTSLPIPSAGGELQPKPLHHIVGGLLTLGSAWKPPLGDALSEALTGLDQLGRLDLGCVAGHGVFAWQDDGTYNLQARPRAATAFLFELIARLQLIGTAPMVDVRAYARWITSAKD